MRPILRIILLLSLFGSLVLLSSCDKESPQEETFSNTALDSLLIELSVNLLGQTGTIEDGLIPFDSNSSSPLLVSGPTDIDTRWAANERIDLVFEVDAAIEEVYFTISGADTYYSFTNPPTEIPGQTQAVSLIFHVPAEGPGNTYCLSISVKDNEQRLSNRRDVCIRFLDEAPEDRLIYVIDSAPNSILSTFNFNTSQIVEIGPTGFEILDIAFVGNDLYGVTASSELINIDPVTGESNILGPLETSAVYALESNRSSLYGLTASGSFMNINRETGETTLVSEIGSGITSTGDLSYQFFLEKFYGTVNIEGSINDQFIAINSENGATEFIGDTGFNDILGMALVRNQFYGLTKDGKIIILERITGRGTLVEIIDDFCVGGAAVVPESI